jgi:hypothetical protein
MALMRVNLLTQSSGPVRPGSMTIPLSLTIKPSCGLPGDYLYPTDSASLLRLLKRSTDLPATVIKKFEGSLYTSSFSKLLGVDLKDSALEDMGYFID